VIDTIVNISPRIVAGVIPRECLVLCGLDMLEGGAPGRVKEGREEAWRTLVANRGPEGRLPPSWYNEAFLDALFNTNGNGDLDINSTIAKSSSPLMTRYLERVRDVTWNRRLTKTTDRHLGLIPGSAKTNDLICIVEGCSVPVILRPQRIDESFEVIGECYIHGIMEGEAMPDSTHKFRKIRLR